MMTKLTWRIPPIVSMTDMQARIIDLGFLPMFGSGIKGYSVYEASPNFWTDDGDGPWEWKGPVIREGEFAYGKFFNRKAVWISLEWLPEFINYRRTKHLAPNEDFAALDEIVLQLIEAEGAITSRMIATEFGLSGRKRKRTPDDLVDNTYLKEKISVDTILSRLMMEGRVVISDFVYNMDRHGNPYGWGIAKYSTPENIYGSLATDLSPEESYARMLSHLKTVVPVATDSKLKKLLG